MEKDHITAVCISYGVPEYLADGRNSITLVKLPIGTTELDIHCMMRGGDVVGNFRGWFVPLHRVIGIYSVIDRSLFYEVDSDGNLTGFSDEDAEKLVSIYDSLRQKYEQDPECDPDRVDFHALWELRNMAKPLLPMDPIIEKEEKHDEAEDGFAIFMKNPFWRRIYEGAPGWRLKEYFRNRFNASKSVTHSGNQCEEVRRKLEKLILIKSDLQYLQLFAKNDEMWDYYERAIQSLSGEHEGKGIRASSVRIEEWSPWLDADECGNKE
ncbi:MAG: hypothetical protein IKF49_06880 [Clostridia bacterium]|nr:hypothetical protein [Clostridia bacterium]